MKKRSIERITMALLIIFVLGGCTTKHKIDSAEETAKIFVQSLIDGDEEKFDQINKNPGETTQGAMGRYAPEFSGLKLSDFNFETNGDEITVTHGNGDKRIRYWLTIEKIGDKYFVTHY